MAILSFPLMLPMLLSLMKLSAMSLGMQELVNIWGICLVLILLTAISVVLAFILFPYLWRD
jgi:heme exporter protein B